jgi:hypothetical protein
MNDTREKNEFPDPEKLRELITCMGLGLITWERVEDEHYGLFSKLLNYPNESMCSVLYHSPPSFESRRTLVDRAMEASIMPTEFRATWKKINKRLSNGSEHRGQLAHFGLGFEVEFLDKNEPLSYRLLEPHLRPSLKNQLKSKQGKGYENPKFRITTATIAEYVSEFTKLAADIAEFRRTLIVARMPRAKAPRLETPPKSLSKVAPLLVHPHKNQKAAQPFSG